MNKKHPAPYVSPKSPNDKDFLTWIHARLVNIHGENPNIDYMRRLKKLTEFYDRNA